MTVPWTRRANGLRLTLAVQPRARKDAVLGLATDRDGRAALRVAVTAPPVEGAANDAVAALIARALDVPRRAVALVAGAGGRTKLVDIEGDPAHLAGRLAALAAPK
jgi:uncharacterized protein